MQDLSLPELAAHVSLLRSDHARFWVAGRDQAGLPVSLPAIVLHDTGPHRGGMEDCYHGPCDIYDHQQAGGGVNWDFLLQTTQTLIGKKTA